MQMRITCPACSHDLGSAGNQEEKRGKRNIYNTGGGGAVEIDLGIKIHLAELHS